MLVGACLHLCYVLFLACSGFMLDVHDAARLGRQAAVARIKVRGVNGLFHSCSEGTRLGQLDGQPIGQMTWGSQGTLFVNTF